VPDIVGGELIVSVVLTGGKSGFLLPKLLQPQPQPQPQPLTGSATFPQAQQQASSYQPVPWGFGTL